VVEKAYMYVFVWSCDKPPILDSRDKVQHTPTRIGVESRKEKEKERKEGKKRDERKEKKNYGRM
jgi:hypothetical protein